MSHGETTMLARFGQWRSVPGSSSVYPRSRSLWACMGRGWQCTTGMGRPGSARAASDLSNVRCQAYTPSLGIIRSIHHETPSC